MDFNGLSRRISKKPLFVKQNCEKLESDHLFPLVILCFSNFLWKSMKINENQWKSRFFSLRDQVEDDDQVLAQIEYDQVLLYNSDS